MVHRGGVERADEAIQAAGWRRTRPDFRLTPLQTTGRYLPRSNPNSNTFATNPASGWNSSGGWRGWPMQAGHLGQTRSPAPSEGIRSGRWIRARMPSTFRSTVRGMHGTGCSGWSSIALLLQDPGLDWEATVSLARRTGVERPPAPGRSHRARLLGAGLPPALVPRPSEQTVVASLAPDAVRQVTRKPSQDEYSADWFRQTRYRTRLARGAKAKFSVLAPHLLSPEGWRMWPLPRPLVLPVLFRDAVSVALEKAPTPRKSERRGRDQRAGVYSRPAARGG